MKDGTTHLAYKPEHAVDLDTGAVKLLSPRSTMATLGQRSRIIATMRRIWLRTPLGSWVCKRGDVGSTAA